jgi:hypothetical protein
LKDVEQTLVEPYVTLLQYLENLGTSDQWRRLEVIVTNTGAGAVSADTAVMTFDITNITGGQLDSTWTAGDYTTCETAFTNFFNSMSAAMPNWRTVSQYRWYRRQFTPIGYVDPADGRPKKFYDSGPPERMTNIAIVGSGAVGMVPQACISFTEKTPWARHWGRFYYPGVNSGHLASGGRFASTNMNTWKVNVSTLYSGLAGSDFQIAVPVTSIDKVDARVLLNVTSVQIDDIPDVIRRRRPKFAALRVVAP